MLKVKEAQEELAKKTYNDIQIETAWKWASRASASYENVLSVEYENKLACYLLAQEYEHESREHAALVLMDHPENILKQIDEAIFPYGTRALEELERVFGV